MNSHDNNVPAVDCTWRSVVDIGFGGDWKFTTKKTRGTLWQELPTGLYTDKNNRNIWRNIQKIVPNFLKMRIFLTKIGE